MRGEFDLLGETANKTSDDWAKYYREQQQLKDFRNFLYLCWKHLNLPNPTPVQFDIADYIQSKEKRSFNIIRSLINKK